MHGVDLSVSAQALGDQAALRHTVREELGVPEGHVLVLTVANLRAEKGYDVLLGAARRVADAGRAGSGSAAVGRGPLREELEATHRSLGLGERFRFLGQRSDVLRLLAGADIFVLASHHEGLPVALMEATSLGLPVVATAVGEVPSVIRDDQEGVIVAPGQADALAEALLGLASDPARRDRLGRASLARELHVRHRRRHEGDRGDLHRAPRRPTVTGVAGRRLVHVTTADISLALLLGPQLRAFADAGMEVIGASAPGPFVEELVASGIPHEPLRHATRSMAPGHDVLAIGELVRLFRRLRPDIVHTHNPKPGLYGRLAARIAVSRSS